MMREILEIERRLSQLTPESPDYTDGKLTPVTINELQVLFLLTGKPHNDRKTVVYRTCELVLFTMKSNHISTLPLPT